MNLKTTIRRDGVKVHYLPSTLNAEDHKESTLEQLLNGVENFLHFCVKKVRKVKRQIKH